MQKNLDHYEASSPGNFSAYLWSAAGKSTFWGAVPDTPAPTLSLYSVVANIPASTAPGNYTLQTVYATNNQGAPGFFYQCSDVQILAPTSEARPVDPHHDCTKH
jgi:hypothetical protein